MYPQALDIHPQLVDNGLQVVDKKHPRTKQSLHPDSQNFVIRGWKFVILDWKTAYRRALRFVQVSFNWQPAQGLGRRRQYRAAITAATNTKASNIQLCTFITTTTKDYTPGRKPPRPAHTAPRPSSPPSACPARGEPWTRQPHRACRAGRKPAGQRLQPN